MTNIHVKTTVPLEPILFRSESEHQGEEKGGYLIGESPLLGLDPSKYEVSQIDICLESAHPIKYHSNLLRISRKHCSMKENGCRSKKIKGNMSPEAFKITIARNESNKMVLDSSGHHDYLSSAIKNIEVYNENTQTLKYGGHDGLNIGIVKPYSKQENGAKGRVHIRDVLIARKLYELKQELKPPNEVSKQLEIFKHQQLGIQSKKEKEQSINLENFLSETQTIHKAKLKEIWWIRPKNRAGLREKVEGSSEWILASNLYSMTIDKKRTNIQLLDNASLRLLNIMLSDCKATLALRFEAEFMYQQVLDEITFEDQISDGEIKIFPVLKASGSEKSSESQSVLRVGGSKIHTLQLYYKSKCGQIIKKVKDGEGRILLKIKMLDDSGIGIWDAIDVKIIKHDCEYDKYLQSYDELNSEIATEDMINQWKLTGRLVFRPCCLCEYDGLHARRQYHVEAQNDSKCNGKRRSSQNIESDGIVLKRNRSMY